jgi:hypothetical protein
VIKISWHVHSKLLNRKECGGRQQPGQVPPDLLLEAVVMARAPACRRNRAWAPTRLQPFVVSERLGSVDPTVIQLAVVVHMVAVAVLAEVHRVPQLGTRHHQIKVVV